MEKSKSAVKTEITDVDKLIVDIKEVKAKYPKSEFPCLDYSKQLLKDGFKSDLRLEVWNYDRLPAEADWTVPNIGAYVKNEEYVRNYRVRGPFSCAR